MFKQTRPLIPYALFLLPGIVGCLPLNLRVFFWAVLALEGLYFWSKRRESGAYLLSTSVVLGWVTLASYPLEISKVDNGVIYLLLLVLVILPWSFFRFFNAHIVLWLSVATLMMLGARPGQRFAEGQNHPAIEELAASLNSVEETTAWVHQHIERRKGPPTDTAVTTLKRGYGHCGAMNNLLHKLLLAQGYDARMIHLDGDSMHTLVQVGDRLADGQENVVKQFSAHLLPGTTDASLPEPWRGHRRLWIYDPSTGYRLRSK